MKKNMSNLYCFKLIAVPLLTAVVLLVSSCCPVFRHSHPAKPFGPAIGVCTSVSKGGTLNAAGYEYVEEGVQRFLIPNQPEEKFLENYRKLQAAPLPILACNGFLPGSLKSVGPDPKHDEILTFAETAFRRAKISGIKFIVFGSSGSRSIPKGFDVPKAKQQFVSLLKRMGPIAGKYGVVVVIEPLNRSETNFINSLADGAEIVRLVDHPNVKLLADIYHMLRENEPANEIIKAGEYLRHCHIAENKDRGAPGAANEDFTPYFAALKQIGYTGAISVECRWRNFDEETPVVIDYLKQQIAIVNQKAN